MSVTDSDVVVDQRQVTVGDVEVIIINEVTVFDIENTGSTTTAIATGSTSNNLIQSVVIGNVLDPDLTDPSDPGDPGFVPGSSTLDVSLATGTGPSSNAVIASVQELTAASVFGAIRGTNEITTDSTPPSNETVTLGVNAISSAVVLQEAENRLTGILDPTFNNTDAGSVVINTLDAADGSAILGPGDLDTGLLIGNVQVVREVDSGTPNALGVDAFASVAGTASIANIIDGNFGSNLSVIADENTIGAFFEGNAAVNVLDVEAGGGNTLNSAAGIASVQISDRVESGSGSNAVIDVDTGRISVNIFSPNPNRSLDDSTLSFANNTVTATATGNTVFSDVNLADGISFDGPSDGALAINSVQPDEVDVEQRVSGYCALR